MSWLCVTWTFSEGERAIIKSNRNTHAYVALCGETLPRMQNSSSLDPSDADNFAVEMLNQNLESRLLHVFNCAFKTICLFG